MSSYSAPPIRVGRFRHMRRMDLVFGGVEQAGPSFEVRVFLNNPSADEGTPQTPDNGYAGTFHVYGYGKLPPPAIAEAKRDQTRDEGPVAPIEKRLHVDEAAARAALEASDELIVTVVPVPSDPGTGTPERPFERVDVMFQPAATEP
jgi:hypothetical protein